MKKFKFIFCDRSLKADLCKFISANWKKNHILSTNERLLDWQYKDDKGNYNFVLAIEDKKIIGILGFIPSNKFSNINDLNYCLALWSIDRKTRHPGIGIGMISFLKKEKKLRGIYTIGLSRDAVEIYDSLKYNIAHLNHYIFINERVKDFKILKNLDTMKSHFIKEKDEQSVCGEIKSQIELSNIFIKNLDVNNHFKNKNYIISRYLNHPYYKYRLLYVNRIDDGCILVLRKVSVNKSSALRIIDCIGNVSLISYIGATLERLLKDENHEYLDFLQFGIDSKILQNAGFKLVEEFKNLVVPNNFEPFEQKNKKIFLAFKNFEKGNKCNNYFFKGDGDQDRPSII